jgi:nicotinamide-nucleotide amidase
MNQSNHSNAFTDNLVQKLASALLQRGWFLTSAESCTGGLIAASCTHLAGSSDWFERGFVTYSNASKSELLGVDSAAIQQHGAVSEVVARAMALGGLRHSKAQVSVAVTGVAGPGGGSENKPVGSVWFAWAMPSDEGPAVGGDAFWVTSELMHFSGDRAAVRNQTVDHALTKILTLLKSN